MEQLSFERHGVLQRLPAATSGLSEMGAAGRARAALWPQSWDPSSGAETCGGELLDLLLSSFFIIIFFLKSTKTG